MPKHARTIIVTAVFVLLALLGAIAFGGVTSAVISPGLYELRTDDNAVIRDANGVPIRAESIEQCHQAAVAHFAAAPAGVKRYRCVHAGAVIEVKADCADVPPPEFVPELLEPSYCPAPNDFRYEILETEQTPAPYPQCWTVTKKIVARCEPGTVAIEYDDPADPPLELMAMAPLEHQGGGGRTWDVTEAPWESPDVLRPEDELPACSGCLP